MKFGSITTGIVSDGLVFNMDAANRASYPKTGVKWNDTVNGNDTTLTNDPTFNSGDIEVGKYLLNYRKNLNVIGQISENFWNNKKTIQLIIKDLIL